MQIEHAAAAQGNLGRKTILATVLSTSLIGACGSPPTEQSPTTGASHEPALVQTETPSTVLRDAENRADGDRQGATDTASGTTKTKVPAEAEVATASRLSDDLASGTQEITANQALHSVLMEAKRAPHIRPGITYPEPVPPRQPNRERYEEVEDNQLFWADRDPVSTFSIDVDTAAYANVRRFLNQGNLPKPNAVRVEELLNYFDYGYPQHSIDAPFSVYTEVGPSPWASDRSLVHIGVHTPVADIEEQPPANLVFLIDVSGSMRAPNKLGLLRQAMKMMAKQLRPQDRISIAVYAGSSGAALEPTSGADVHKITNAIDALHAGGSTNGGAGIQLAYKMAKKHFIKDGINRVILATDGDFNVGTTNIDELERMVERERKSGVALTVLGFGAGNYNDHLMQKIAQIGNGNAAYIDSMNEARKVLVDELAATLNIVAKDVKIQVEFNPAVVSSYRLIGYETRHLEREDFNNDKVDAGEIGAGHKVTALYEVAFVNSTKPAADPLRYGSVTTPGAREATTKQAPIAGDEIAFVKLRYKAPDATSSRLMTQPVRYDERHSDLQETTDAYRFSAAVAWFGQILREGKYVDQTQMNRVIELANTARGSDPFGYRAEFVGLARTAAVLSSPSHDVTHGGQ